MAEHQNVRHRERTSNLQEFFDNQRPFFTPQNSPDKEDVPKLKIPETCDVEGINRCPRKFSGSLNIDSQGQDGQCYDTPNTDSPDPWQSRDDCQQDSPMHVPMHDWRSEKAAQREFFDDGTMTYFWSVSQCECCPGINLKMILNLCNAL